MADTLILLAMAVRSGLGLTEALAQVAECSTGPVRRDLAAVVAALRWGRPTRQAWLFAGAPWRPAAVAWTVSERTGAPPGELLERAAERSRHAEDRAAERRAARAGVLLVLPLGFGFLPAFAGTAVIPVVLALARGVLRA
ncbi:MAG TPA: type II secretion system F family protein [Pedococcus sp.]|nr:type II secretion system F family protein [Pedococcus sp.]